MFSALKITSFGNKSFEVKGVENATIRVFNLKGRLVQTIANAKERQTVDLNKETTGLYLIRISKNGADSIHKVIVK